MQPNKNIQQIKLLVDNIFIKHTTNNSDTMSLTQLYQFFSATLTQNITIVDVQNTLKQIKTQNSNRITKKQMITIIGVLIENKKNISMQKQIQKQKYQKRLNNNQINSKIESNNIRKPNLDRYKSQQNNFKPFRNMTPQPFINFLQNPFLNNLPKQSNINIPLTPKYKLL